MPYHSSLEEKETECLDVEEGLPASSTSTGLFCFLTQKTTQQKWSAATLTPDWMFILSYRNIYILNKCDFL